MIESNSVEVGSGDLISETATGPSLATAIPIRPFAAALEYPRVLSLALLLAIAILVRTLGLGASGFSEDEIHKLRAIQAYGRWDFTANAEHPMLMKLGDWASFTAARWWNAHGAFAAITTISPEAAIRLPNAMVGGATTSVVFLLAETLFDTTVGAWAGLFWALDVNAAAINRIGKEDTFLLFFLLLAAYLFERGKAASIPDRAGGRRWFILSGGSFGLMLASKYMPHYFGLHALFNIAAPSHPHDDKPDKRLSFFVAMGALFLAGNFAVLLPGTWAYIAAYAHGDTLRHSGYNFAHHVYVNAVDATPWGLPPTFYVMFLATKVSLVVLAAAIVGFLWAARHPSDRGATFLRVFLVFTLVPYSLVASKFLRYMLPLLAVIDIAAGVGIAWLLRQLDTIRARAGRELLAGTLALVAIVPPLTQQISSAPFYSLTQNALGARLAPRGWFFPDDEFYDAGVREAVAAIATAAAPGAVVCSDATAVVDEYLDRHGRADVRSCSIAHDGLPMTAVDTWVVAQDGHTYFENLGVIEQLQRRMHPWTEIRIAGVLAAQVFHVQQAPQVAHGPREP